MAQGEQSERGDRQTNHPPPAVHDLLIILARFAFAKITKVDARNTAAHPAYRCPPEARRRIHPPASQPRKRPRRRGAELARLVSVLKRRTHGFLAPCGAAPRLPVSVERGGGRGWLQSSRLARVLQGAPQGSGRPDWPFYPRLEGVGGGFAAASRGYAPKGRPNNEVLGKRTKIKGEHRSTVTCSSALFTARNEVSTENRAFRSREGVGGGLFSACVCFEVPDNSHGSGRH